MTILTWTSAFAHSDNATFRAWGSELSAKLAEAGLIKTADTGQIDWLTAARPVINTAAGYEIWRFNDALQATAPIFLKLEYGTGTGAATPGLWLTVGTGSNGAGTLTGTTTGRALATFSTVPSVASFPSYLCVGSGFVGLSHKAGAVTGSGFGFFAISRTFDGAGAPSGQGCIVLWGAAGDTAVALSQCLRFAATAVAYTASTLFSLVPAQVLASFSGTDYLVYPVFGISPSAWVVPTLATVISSEIPGGTLFSVAMGGGPARTLISVPSRPRSIVIGTGPGAFTTYHLAMLWE